MSKNYLSSEEREQNMLKTNPKYVLKNYMLQEAIDGVQRGNFSIFEALFEIAQNPYEEHSEYERWAGTTPDEFKNQKLSCSS